jgi:OPA family glycerol-3-phosphate transporter-like MFS transporter/OPA family sugar phosphate sensor protein UhpC-like MFS transporter
MTALLAALKAQPDSAAVVTDRADIDRRYRYWRFRILSASLVGYAVYYFVRTNISVALPAMQKDLGYSKAQLGIILSVGGVVYGVSKFANGFLGDRANPRYFMALGLLLCAAMNVLFGMSRALTALTAFWFMNNWAQGMGFPPCARNMGYWFSPKERGTTFGIWHTGHTAGAALVAVLTGFIVKETGNWRLCFFVPAGIAVAGALMLLIRLRDTPGSMGLPPVEVWKGEETPGELAKELHSPVPVTQPAGAEREGEAPVASPEQLSDATVAPAPVLTYETPVPEESYWRVVIDNVFRSPFMWVISVANLLVYTLRYAALHWGPTYLQEMKKISPMASSSLLSAAEFAGMGSAVIAGYAADRFFGGRAGRVCVIAMLLMAAALYAFRVTPVGNKAMAGACYVVMSFMVYVPQMLIAAMAMNLGTKRAAAAAVGLTGIFGYLSSVLSGWGVGALVDRGGWDGAFNLMIGCAVATAALMAVTWNVGAHPHLEKLEERTPAPGVAPAQPLAGSP